MLEKLSEAIGVSGNEDEVRQIIKGAIAGHVDECRTDTMGNLIAVKRRNGSDRRVMVAAHMDEVGLMITRIEDNGMLRFSPVGGIDNRVLAAKAVLIGDKRVPGVIGMPAVHLTEKNERDRVVEYRKLSIDIGATTKAEAERTVTPGQYAVFATEFTVLDEESGGLRTVRGKAFDDRAGCAALIEVLKGNYPFELDAVFTVQEEVGLRGARVASYAVSPDCAFAIECTGANEIPTGKDVSPSTRIGEGPAITVADRSFIADTRLVRLLSDTAEEIGVPYQVKQPGIGGTDAGAIQPAREGVPCVTVAVPCRYIHSPASILSLTDFENTIRLVQESLVRLPARMSW